MTDTTNTTSTTSTIPVEFCPNCGEQLGQQTVLGVLEWVCPNGDFEMPVDYWLGG